MTWCVRMDYEAYRTCDLVGAPEQWCYYTDAATEHEAKAIVMADRAKRIQPYPRAQIVGVELCGWVDRSDPRFIAAGEEVGT